MPPVLDDVRLKDAEELDDEDKKVLRESKDDLTDDEKEYYKDALSGEGEGKEEGEEEEDKGKGFSFKTQEELDQYMEKKLQEREDKRKADEEEKKRAKKEELFFDKDYKPKDWEQFAKDLYPKVKERIVKEAKDEDARTKQDIDDWNKKWDGEVDEIISKDKDLPRRGGEKFTEFTQALNNIMVNYKLVSMHNAYDIYQMKNKLAKPGEGEGEEGTPREGAETEERRRELASKVGKGAGTKTTTKTKLYKDVPRNLDDAFAAAAERLEKM